MIERYIRYIQTEKRYSQHTVDAYRRDLVQFFEYVFHKLGITDKKEVLIIGDSLTSDMKGGYTAGIDTCWYNPEHKPNTLNIPVTYEIDNLDSITGILE